MAGPRDPNIDEIVTDGRWLAHRYDEAADMVRFRFVDRQRHASIIFLTDAELGTGQEISVPRAEALAAVRLLNLPPARYIIHSAFCCSTLLARACDVPGHLSSIKEPQILNDVIGLQLRGGDPRQVAAAMDVALALLDRPLAGGERVVVKPSNLVNPLLPLQLKLRPDSRLLFLHAPLRDFLGSIARKEIEGRAWVRELMWKYINLGMARRFGFSDEELYRHSDLQVAALTWLAQYGLMQELAAAYPDTVRAVTSDELTGRTDEVVTAMVRHFGVDVDAGRISASDAFGRHSKSGDRFDAGSRDEERALGLQRYGREIDMVMQWAERLSAHAGIAPTFPYSLI